MSGIKSEDMSERMEKDMSERMSEDMSEDMSERMSKDMSKRMPEDMSERMAKDMSERMSEDMSENKLYFEWSPPWHVGRGLSGECYLPCETGIAKLISPATLAATVASGVP